VLRRRNVLYFLDNAIVVTIGQIARTSSVAIEPLAYAAMQKKVWLRKKNAYLMLARVGVTLGPALISWLIPLRSQSRSTPIDACIIQRRARM
jgi:hypothetical protein